MKLKTIIVDSNIIVARDGKSRAFTARGFLAWRFLLEHFNPRGVFARYQTVKDSPVDDRAVLQEARRLAGKMDNEAAMITAANYILAESWVYSDIDELLSRVRFEARLSGMACWIEAIDGIDKLLAGATLLFRRDGREHIKYC